MPAKKIIKRAVVGILLTLVALVVAGGMMGFAKTPAKLDFEEAQIWAHRGLSVEFEENSLNAIREAFDAGAAGVEIDVHYIAKFDRFTVMHDAWENSNLDELLTLETVFRSKIGRAHV